MAWTAPKTWSVGEVLTAANMNAQVRDNELMLSTHVHSGAAGDGSSSLGPLDRVTYTDVGADPAAPGAGKTTIYAVSGRVHYRSGAAGVGTRLVDQTTAEALSGPKTLTLPVISDFSNANHDHLDTAGGGTIPGVAVHVVKRKAADETVNNSATLQNDDDFSFAVGTSETWIVDQLLELDLQAGVNWQFTWTLPASATMRVIAQVMIAANYDATVLGATPGTGIVVTRTSTAMYVRISTVIVVAGTGGTAQFQWAQATAAVGNFTVKTGSWMVAHKV